MAAIDKLRVESYYDREALIIWCITHRPQLLNGIYSVFDCSKRDFDKIQRDLINRGSTENVPKVAIASFSRKDDSYLYWHCPLDFIREYLHEQCGYKDNWFVKLFWKR
jgi:hypothetical protein